MQCCDMIQHIQTFLKFKKKKFFRGGGGGEIDHGVISLSEALLMFTSTNRH